MKKTFKSVIPLALAIIMVATLVASSLSVHIFASDGQIITLDIVWDDISFTYDEKNSTWNPSNHSYKQDGVTPDWTDNSGKITVTNYSTVDITVDIAFKQANTPNGTAVLKVNNPTFTLRYASSNFSTITAEGVPTSDATIGRIIVSVNTTHTHNFVNGVCDTCGFQNIYKREGDIVYFGEYPQTVKDRYVTVSDTADSRGYFLGSDGAYYAMVTATPYESGYKFSTDAEITSKTVYYFKVEPLKWRVIYENGRSLTLLCESIIANKRYDDDSNDYESSEIRSWLNESFYATAFSELEKTIIKDSLLVGNDKDKVSLASYLDVNALEQSIRAKNVSDYARASGAWISTSYLEAHNGNGLWTLRNPNSEYTHFVHECDYNGDISDGGTNLSSTYLGVVPMLKVEDNIGANDDFGEVLKVMTYNLKNGSPSAERKTNTINDIKKYMPDTIGTQETHLKWLNALKDGLGDEYEIVGEQRYGDEVSREQNDNEASAILYRRSKFNLIDSGTYWLSETPEVVNTKLEESKYVRIMTFVVLERKSDGVKFVHVNTHLNTTPSINLRQVQILVSLVNEKVYAKHGELPTYFTGDMNVDPINKNDDGYKYFALIGTEDSRAIAELTTDKNTITGGGRIDHCLVTKGDFVVSSFDVSQERSGDQYSNHYPVYVEMYFASNVKYNTHAHSYATAKVEPTYLTKGYTAYTCQCGKYYNSDYVDEKTGIPLATSEYSATIIMPADASLEVLYARDKIQLDFEAISGLSLSEGADTPFEILIGDTGREESIALKSTLAEDEYAIKTVNKKIVIAASNEAFLYEAAKYFCDNYLKTSKLSANGGEFVLLDENINVKREGDKTSIHYNLSLGTHLNAHGTATYTLNNERYGAADADPRIYRRQGGCFNGEIYYQVFISKNEEIAVIGRQNVITGELIYSEPRYMEHSNDATYNPYTDRLYVGNGTTVWVYDGTTLEFIESLTLSHSTARFSYSPERHKYVAASYRIYDESFNYTGVYLKSQLKTLYGDLDLTSQGTACDDTFIYSLVFETVETGVYNAYLGFFDWYGNTLAFVTVDIPGKFEPESVSIVDGKLYIAACSTQPVATLYEITFD